MPRSRSISIESSTCSTISRSGSPPVSWIKRSASVDFPWSICATMAKLRIWSIGAVVMARDLAPVLQRGKRRRVGIGAEALAFRPQRGARHRPMRRPAAPIPAWSAFWRAPLALGDRLCAALLDPNRRERNAVLVLGAYAALWTLYGIIAKSSQDIHFDMGEALAWSRELAVGNPKHPPLSAVVVKAWFSVFPRADWAYYALAVTIAAAGLWIAWRLSERWLDAEKRVAGLALMSLVPFFNFQALKFNANTVLIPLWAATTYCFVRSFESHRASWAALAGLCAAGAMLGKYWSIVLLLGLGVAALLDPRRGAYFRSAAPWVTIAVGALALTSHGVWLVTHGFGPILYAASEHPSSGTLATLVAALGFLVGTAGYVAIPVTLTLMAARATPAALRDTLYPHTPDRRFAAVAFVAPLLLSVLLAVAAGALIVSLWAMPALTLLPVVALSSPQLNITREALARLVTLAVAFPAVVLEPATVDRQRNAGRWRSTVAGSSTTPPIIGFWRGRS